MPRSRILRMASSALVIWALEALGIPWRLHVHEKPLRSLEQAPVERGLLPDRSLLDAEVISLGVRLPNEGVILKRDDLLRALNPELGDFQEQEGWGT
jgi:hypothetical protein